MPTLLKRFLFAGLLMTLLAACAPAESLTPLPPDQQAGNPYAPQPGDESLIRDSIEVVKTEVLTLESSLEQYMLKIFLFTPTTCHQYRISMNPPTMDGKIKLEVYSLMEKDQVCTLMQPLDPTEASLNLGSLPAGHYTIWVNGVKSAEFDA